METAASRPNTTAGFAERITAHEGSRKELDRLKKQDSNLSVVFNDKPFPVPFK